MEDTRLDPVPLAPPSPFLDEVGAPARVSRRDALGRFSLLAADMLALGGSLVVVTLLTSAHLSPWILALVPLMGLLAKSAGLYDRDQYVLHKTTLDEGPSLLGVAAIVALLTEATQALSFHGRSQPLLLWAALTMALVLTRATARFLVVRGTEAERILIVGDRATAAAMERKLDGDPALNALVVGRVPARSDPHELDPRALGTIDELPRVLEEHQVERVILAPAHGAGEDVVEEIRLAKACGVKVAVLPRLLEVIGSAVEFDDVSGQALLAVRGFGLSRSSQLLKRSLDVVCATLALVLLSPLLLVLAVAVKRSSPGPVLFRQTRIGREGREFQMLKFRTMVRDADALKDELAEHNQAGPALQDRQRPTHHRRRALPATALARRAAAARQRPARRHERRRTAAARDRRGPALLGLAAAPVPRRPGHHGPVADPGLEPGPGRGHGDPRLPLLRELVPLARREDHRPHDPVRAQPPQRRAHRQPALGPRRGDAAGAAGRVPRRSAAARGDAARLPAALVASRHVAERRQHGHRREGGPGALDEPGVAEGLRVRRRVRVVLGRPGEPEDLAEAELAPAQGKRPVGAAEAGGLPGVGRLEAVDLRSPGPPSAAGQVTSVSAMRRRRSWWRRMTARTRRTTSRVRLTVFRTDWTSLENG